MIRRLHAVAIGLALALACAPAAFAGQPVDLRTDPISGRSVTLGDLFDNAGSQSGVMIGYGAPAGQDAVLDAGEVQRLAHLHGLDWTNPGHIRRIVVRSDGSAPSETAVPTGRMVDALTYSRNLAAGDIIQPTDLVYAKVAAFAVPSDAPRDPEAVIGKMVKRPLRSGATAAGHDVSAAQVIKRDDMVQVAFREDGVSLVLQGKAMANAAAGEPVAVLNTLSKKVVQAIAVGPDEAVVGPDAEQYRGSSFNNPLQFATR